MSQRAALLVDIGEDLVVEDVDLVDPGARDVVVAIEASGVCHSDLSVLEGHTGGRPPTVLGHEGAAVIQWTGSEVTRVKVGQRVVLSLMPVCGSCWHCLRQETHLCELGGALFIAPRVKRSDGTEANALMGLGTFAETALVHEASWLGESARCVGLRGRPLPVNRGYSTPSEQPYSSPTKPATS